MKCMTVPVLAARKLRKFELPVPPSELFEELCGYRGNKRYVALYLNHIENGQFALIIESGDNGGPAHPKPFMMFISTPAVWDEIGEYQIGITGEAEDWLMLDRKARRLYVGPFPSIIEVIVSLAHLPQYPNICIEPSRAKLDQLRQWLKDHFA